MHSNSPTDRPPENSAAGVLYIVSTPIGNLSDITLRAMDILKSVDIIAAEDTRHTARLLSHFNITGRLISCHEHNETDRIAFFIAHLKAGEAIALVTDAGTPTVSDPGFRIVTAAIEHQLPVVPIPGVSAAITALSASGLPSDAFCFAGFAPKKKSKRTEFLTRLSTHTETLIFYGSPKRIVSFLKEIEAVMGDRHAVVARELTKIHEEFLRGRLSEVAAALGQRPAIKGEITLLITGVMPGENKEPVISDSLLSEIADALESGEIGASELAYTLSKRYSMPKNKVYKEILKIKSHIAKR